MSFEEIKITKPHSKLCSPRDTGQYILAGPKTLRLACRMVFSNKKKTLPYANFGGNRQNIEGGLRIIWQADKGYKLINRDQSGADALIVAYLAKHGRYRDLFIYGIKPHLYIALNLFPDAWKYEFKNPDYINTALKTEIKDLKNLEFWKDLSKLIKSSDGWENKKRYYFFGKKTGHSGNYGMRGNKLAMSLLEESEGTIVISSDEGEKWIIGYHMMFPEIQSSFHTRVFRQATEKKQLRNLLGSPFNITGFINTHDMKDLYSWIPQSTVADINREGFIKMQEYITFNDKDWHLLGDYHDAILAQAPEKEAEECAQVLKDCLEIELTAPYDNVKFRMKTECQIGYNWAKYDKDTNPNGLQEVNI
jgi:hypothetical protein